LKFIDAVLAEALVMFALQHCVGDPVPLAGVTEGEFHEVDVVFHFGGLHLPGLEDLDLAEGAPVKFLGTSPAHLHVTARQA
jgi:hypothetical protein